jgi:hypothetical protein
MTRKQYAKRRIDAHFSGDCAFLSAGVSPAVFENLDAEQKAGETPALRTGDEAVKDSRGALRTARNRDAHRRSILLPPEAEAFVRNASLIKG